MNIEKNYNLFWGVGWVSYAKTKRIKKQITHCETKQDIVYIFYLPTAGYNAIRNALIN